MKTKNLYLGKFRKQSHRCQQWDYTSEGIYYITINTTFRSRDFGRIENGKMVLNACGEIVEQCLIKIPELHNNMYLDGCVIMPDHIHMIVHVSRLNGDCRDVSGKDVSLKRLYKPKYKGNHKHLSKISPESQSLPVVIRSFKGASTKMIRQMDPEFSWQTNYHDRIIRSEYEYERIQQYIEDNPKNYQAWFFFSSSSCIALLRGGTPPLASSFFSSSGFTFFSSSVNSSSIISFLRMAL